MSRDLVRYLNRGESSPMSHRLLELLRQSTQAKAPASQWINYLKGLAQKGVKARELEDSELMGSLSKGDPKEVFTKDQVLEMAAARLVTIKEVQLAAPYYDRWRHPGGDYSEWLYIANSERDNVIDRIDDIRWNIEDLNFNMDRLVNEPEVLDTLEKELRQLLAIKDKCADFAHHHFTKALSKGHGKNLIAHVRRTLRPDQDLYFIEEVQSDWAQKYRRYGESESIPSGPYITATEDWAGLVLRRHMQLAANSPMKRVGWITGALRNGGLAGGADDLDSFYLKILPKIAEKVIGKAGGKVVMMRVTLGQRQVEVPGFELTDAVRQTLQESLPMYSHANVAREEQPAQRDALRAEIMSRCASMLGSVAKVRVVNRLYDVATGREVAGRYTTGFVQCSLQAERPRMAADHEVWHAAMDLMLSPDEVDLVRTRFAPGTRLNRQVQNQLMALGQHAAARQCHDSALEASAHAFSLWRCGNFTTKPSGWLGRLFEHVRDTMHQTSNWLRSILDRSSTPSSASIEELFEHLSNGQLSQRASDAARAAERHAFA